MTFDTTACLDCVYVQPPDAILSIPPPPLPSFLLPKSSDLVLPGNNHSQPCFAAFMCETSLNLNSDHIEYIELPRNPNLGIDEPWFFVLICILCAVLFVSAILSIILLKCRDNNCSYHDANLKHQMTFSRERDPNANAKMNMNGYTMGNGQLVPAYNPPLPVLWATLTPHGTTQHFVTDPYPQEDHYEAIDYNRKAYQACVNDLNKTFTTPKKTMSIKSNQGPFENSGFVDFEDYADPSPLIGESSNNLDSEEIDSGISGEYQDPQQFSTGSSNGDFLVSNGSINSNQQFSRGSPLTMSRQRIISTPTRIVNPNVVIPPLNSRTLAKNIKNATLSQQSSPLYSKRVPGSLSRRSSENQ